MTHPLVDELRSLPNLDEATRHRIASIADRLDDLLDKSLVKYSGGYDYELDVNMTMEERDLLLRSIEDRGFSVKSSADKSGSYVVNVLLSVGRSKLPVVTVRAPSWNWCLKRAVELLNERFPYEVVSND